MVHNILTLAAIACLAVSLHQQRKPGPTKELLLPPFRLVFGPGANWAFAGLCCALLGGVANG